MKRIVAAVLALTAAACTTDDSVRPQLRESTSEEIVIGSFDFTENQILAEVYALTLEAHGYPVRRLPNVASREIMAPAMDQAFVDLVIEYQGTALTFVEMRDEPLALGPRATYNELKDELADRGGVAFDFAPVENKNEVVVSASTAAEHDLVTISDLHPIASELVFGGPPECPSRPLCLAGLETTYGLEFNTFQPLDAGGPLTAAALRSGEIDAGILFTTSPFLVGGDLTVLKDDHRLQPPENIVPIARDDVVAKHGHDFVRLIDSITARLSTLELRTLNQRVEIGGEDPDDVATDWVREEGLAK